MTPLIGLLLTGLLVANDGRTRVDLFDSSGRRTGYMIIDERGRIDRYDQNSRRTGSGRIERGGYIDLYDKNGAH